MGEYQTPKIQKYDYGPYKNMKKYGDEQPPEYNLENIQIPVYLFQGTTDLLATPKNVNILKYFLKKYYSFNYDIGHGGFLWGKDMAYLEDLVNVIE
jgi:homoserine acetyltransferase